MEMRFLWNLSRCPGAGFLKSTEKLWHHERKFRFSTFLFKNTNFFDKFPAARNPNKRWVGLICIYLIKKQTNQKKHGVFQQPECPEFLALRLLSELGNYLKRMFLLHPRGKKYTSPKTWSCSWGPKQNTTQKCAVWVCDETSVMHWLRMWIQQTRTIFICQWNNGNTTTPQPDRFRSWFHIHRKERERSFFFLVFYPLKLAKIRINKST